MICFDQKETCIEELWQEFPSFTQYEVRSALAKCGLCTDVERAFLILDEDDQLIIGLSVYGGYNSKEIGEMLKMNPNTVRSRRKRALEKMSWLLKE